MVMRYRGSAPGHTSTRAATDYFLDDLDELDEQERQEREDALAEEQSDEDVDMDEGDEGNEDEEEGEEEEDLNEVGGNELYVSSFSLLHWMAEGWVLFLVGLDIVR